MWVALSSVVTIRRRTAFLLDRTTAGATMAWDRQPAVASVLELRVVGGTGTGQFTVAGTSSGVAATETLVTTGPGYTRTSRTWTALAANATTSGLADESPTPQLEVRAVGVDGSEAPATYTLRTGWPAAIDTREPSWPGHVAAGRVESGIASLLLAYDETWEPREGDLVDDDLGQTFEVIATPRKASALLGPHWSCRARRYESAG